MSRPDLSGNTIASKYKLLERLGGGAFGDVYRGVHQVVGNEFALKMIEVHPSTYSASALEAQLQHLSAHDHIVEVRTAEYWRDPKGRDYFLIQMEYVPGGNFQDLIDGEGSIESVVSIMKNVLFALDHANAMHVVHRDVKPTNILLGNGGKLSDFGIAMVAATGTTASEYVYGGNLAPECFLKPPNFSNQSDVFAAGLTLLRGLNLIGDWRTARLAVPDWKSKMAAGKFVGQLGFHPRVPERLKRIVRRACSEDLSRRYASAKDFRDALEGLNFSRDWKWSGSAWECDHDGLPERIELLPDRGAFAVEYTRNGRRKVAECRARLSQPDAAAHAYRLMAESTLA